MWIIGDFEVETWGFEMQVKIFELDKVDKGILNWTSRNAVSLVVLGPEAISYFLS